MDIADGGGLAPAPASAAVPAPAAAAPAPAMVQRSIAGFFGGPAAAAAVVPASGAAARGELVVSMPDSLVLPEAMLDIKKKLPDVHPFQAVFAGDLNSLFQKISSDLGGNAAYLCLCCGQKLQNVERNIQQSKTQHLNGTRHAQVSF